MARSFVYKRPLDVKILSNIETTNHEFKFNTLLEIKKEIEDDVLDMEAESFSEATAADVSSFGNDHDREFESTATTNQCEASYDATHPKLVIKLGNFWKRSEQSNDSPKQEEQKKDESSVHEILTIRKLRNNKQCRSESRASVEARVTRSSFSKPKITDSDRETKSAVNYSQQKIASFEKGDKEIWNSGQITRLKKNLNISCESCGMCFRTNIQLRSHKRYYTADGEFHCIICDIRFNRDFQLSRHMRVAHSPVGDEARYKFKCHLCIDRFEKKSSLIAHITHLHNKHVLSHQKSMNNNKEVTSFSTAGSKRRRKKTARARKSKSVRKHIVTKNSSDQPPILNDDSNSIIYSAELVENLCVLPEKEDKNVIHENSKMQQNDGCSGNQLTHNIVDFDNREANDNSTHDLINTSDLEYIETILVKKYEQIGAIAKQPFQEKHIQESIDKAALGSKSQLTIVNRNEEQSNQRQSISQSDLETVPRNNQPHLKTGLVDDVGIIIDNSCVSEPLAQTAEINYVTNCTSATTVDLADSHPVIEMINIPPYTKSSILKTMISNSSTVESLNTVPYSEQKLTQNVESSAQGKSFNTIEDDCEIRKVCPHLDGGEQHETPEVLEGKGGSVTTVTAAVERNNFNIYLSQVDDLGETCKTSFINCDDKVMSDGSCESISLRMTASSSSISLVDSVGLDPLTVRDTANYANIKDLRIVLIKLENMPNLLKQNSHPKLLSLENCNFIKSETPYCEVCGKQFESKLALQRHSDLEHSIGSVRPKEESRSINMEDHVILSNCPKYTVFSSQKKVNRKSAQDIGTFREKQCYLCEEVFQNIFSASNHYLSVHSEVGVLKCCLCSIKFNSRRRLRKHLHKHHTGYANHKLAKFCIDCKKEFSTPSLTTRCSECYQNSKIQRRNMRRKQYWNAQYVPKHNSVPSIGISSISISEGREKQSTHELDHESAKRDGVVLSKTCVKVSKNLKCLICNCVFLESRRLEVHLSTVHANVNYFKRRRCRNVAKPQALTHSISREHEPRQRSENRRDFEEFIIRNQRNFRSKVVNTHDKLCPKKLSAWRRFQVSQINSKNQHFIRRRHISGNRKICYNHKCDVCGLNCCCSKKLKIHKRYYSTNGNYVCNICGLTFAWKHVLVMHIKTAHNPKSFTYGRVTCDICNQGFYNKKFLRIHLAHFHGIKYYQCKICWIRFDTRRGLTRHRQIYSKNSSSVCDTCGQSFKCKYVLEYHIAQVHNREKLEAYKYFCGVCNHAFLDELLLQAHIGHFHHNQDRKATININKSETMKQLVENIELPVKTEVDCTNLDVITNNSTIRKIGEQLNPVHRGQTTEDMIDKIRIHTPGEYKCGICKLSFKDPYAMLNHEWEFSNDGAHVCDICNRKFMTRCLLKNHKIKHYQGNVIREYECYVCQEDFSRADHLKMHGLHLHGPSFTWEKRSGADNICNQNKIDCQENPDRDVISKKISVDDTYDTIGLMANNKVSENREILFFRKIVNSRPSVELLRRNSNEETHCCNFCKMNFSSASLLNHHVKKHAYRAYYTNSSRYLCLICKNKFRTNDILRAHVIHFHTSDKKEPSFSEPGCSKDSIPDKLIIPPTHSDIEQINIDNEENKMKAVASNSLSKENHLKVVVQNQPSMCEKRHSIQRPIDTPPIKKLRLSNSASDGDIFQSNHGYHTSLIREVHYKIKTDLKCSVLGSGGDRNGTELDLVKFNDSGNTSHVEPDSRTDEEQLFSFKVTDKKGLERHACTICIMTFQSVAQFKEHFASIHVKNGAYLCTVCGKKFSVISDLKYHTLKHDEERKPDTSCNKEFSLMTDFIRYKPSRKKRIEETENMSHTRLPSSSDDGSLKQTDQKSHFHEIESCKPRNCDKAFPESNTVQSLTQQDSSVDMNGSQCNMCRATFKSFNALRIHKITYHEQKRNSNATQNRRSHRLNDDQTIIALVQKRSIHDNKLGTEITVTDSVKVTAAEKLESAPLPTDKLSDLNKLGKLTKLTAKPFPQVLKKSDNTKECHVYEHQRSNISDISKSRPVMGSTEGTQLSKERKSVFAIAPTNTLIANIGDKTSSDINDDTSSSISFARHPVKLPPKVRQPNKQVPTNIPCNANRNLPLRYLPVQKPNNITTVQFTPNESSLRYRQGAFKEQRSAKSAEDSSRTSNNANYNKLFVQSGIDIVNTRIASSGSSKKSQSNDVEKKKPSNSSPASVNAADHSAYYVSIEDTADSSNTVNNSKIVLSSIQKSQASDCRGKMPSSFTPLSRNRVSPTLLCVKPTSDNSFKYTMSTAQLNESKLKSRPDQAATERLRTLLPKTSSTVNSLSHVSDIQRTVNDSDGNTNHNVTSEASTSRSRFSYSGALKTPTIPTRAGTSTGSGVSASHKNVTNAGNTSADKNVFHKELILSKQVVRCGYCNLLFTEKSKLIKHTELHKTDNQCPACGLAFSTETALQQHLPEHKSSACTRCNMMYFFNDSIVHPQGTDKYCSMCHTVLPLPTRKFNWSASNSTRQLIKCGLCMRMFGTISQMTMHFKTAHSSFACGICNYKFSTKTGLHTHMQTHGSSAIEICQCPTCKLYFVNKSDLAVHALSH